MRRVLSLLVLVAALAVAGTAAAAPGRPVACGGRAIPAAGTPAARRSRRPIRRAPGSVYRSDTSSSSRTASETASSPASRSPRTTATRGLVSCSPTAAWMTGGGVGNTWATFEAHAQWTVNTLHIYNNTDVLTLTVPTIDG